MIEIAYLAVLSIPILVLIAFARFGVQMGIAVSMICAIMFLPLRPAFDPPLLPKMDRETLTLICVALLAFFMEKRTIRRDDADGVAPRWIPRSTLVRLLIACALLFPLGSWLTNRDPLPAPYFDPGMSFVDYGSMTYQSAFVLLAVLVGRRFLSDPAGTRAILVAIAVAGVPYAALNALEWRLSPFLSNAIYGYDAILWWMIDRWGAYRPQLFQPVGLQNASLMLASLMAALVLLRDAGRQKRTLWLSVAACCFVGWIFAWSFGAWAIGLAFGPLLMLAARRLQALFIGLLAVAFTAYPVLTVLELIPTDAIVSFFSMFSESRAHSLEFRFDQEKLILDRVQDRLLFGYGIGDRPFVLNPRGRSIAITDSFFILITMKFGIAGLLGKYFLVVAPLMLLAFYRKRIKPDLLTLGLAMMIGASLVDGLVNATLVSVRWLMVGALIGRIEYELARAKTSAPETDPGSALKQAMDRSFAGARAGAGRGAISAAPSGAEPVIAAPKPSLIPPRGGRPFMARATDRAAPSLNRRQP